MIYLDNAATTKPSARAVARAAEVMENRWGNPSSVHAFGVEGREVVETARGHLARALDANPGEIYFTSGGTESNNLAIFGAARDSAGGHIVTSAVEHSAVSKVMRNLRRERSFSVDYVPMVGGALDLAALEAFVTDKTVLVSVMLVQNEVGTVFPLSEISRIVRRKNPNALLHCDAVQGFGKIPFSVKDLGADLLSVSAHKIHGVAGCGALYIRDGTTLFARQFGGGQERGLRSGTESAALIAAFGEAARIAQEDTLQNAAKMTVLRDYALAELARRFPGVRLNTDSQCAPHIVSFTLPGVDAENTVRELGARGICISNGAACKSNEPRGNKRGQALEAYGLSDELVRSTLRVSFCTDNTINEIDKTLDTLNALLVK